GDDIAAVAARHAVVAVAGVDLVGAGAAGDAVVAGAAGERVVAGAGEHRIVARAAEDRHGVRRLGRVVDIQRLALAQRAAVDRQVAGVVGVAQRELVAVPGGELDRFHVHQRGGAEDDAGAVVAVEDDRVVAGAAVDPVERGEIVVEDDLVVAGAGVDRVVAAVGGDGVVAGATHQLVGRAVADERIGEIGADEAFDVGKDVAD